MKHLLFPMLLVPLLLAACAPAATKSGTASGSDYIAYAPDGPVQPKDIWTVKGTGGSFEGSVTLLNQTPGLSGSRFYEYDSGGYGRVTWTADGFIFVDIEDEKNPTLKHVCVAYDAKPGSRGPYTAYAINGTEDEISAKFNLFRNSDNPYAVLGDANACVISKKN
jgi:hypothetical protein